MTPLALDIAIGLFILLSTVVAYLRGIIKEIFTLLALFLSTFFAYKGGHLLLPEFNEWLNVAAYETSDKKELVLGLLTPPMAAKVFSYGGCFLSVFIIMTITGNLLNRWVKEVGMSVIDRGLGGGFGFLRGFIIIFLVYVPCTYLISTKQFPSWAKDSFSVSILQDTFDWTNETFEIDKMIIDKGTGIAIKINKIDLEKLGKEKIETATKELKDAIEKETKRVQKGIDFDTEDQLSNTVESTLPPMKEELPPVRTTTPDTYVGTATTPGGGEVYSSIDSTSQAAPVAPVSQKQLPTVNEPLKQDELLKP